MKCEICHKADATEAIVRGENGDDELYVCAACAKAEKVQKQRKSQRTRKVIEISSSSAEPIIGAIMDAFKDVVDTMEHVAKASKNAARAERGPKWETLPASRAAEPFRIKGGFHLEGLHLIGELEAVSRGVHALEMELVGYNADGIKDSGHVYELKYTGSAEKAKRVIEDLLREEKNARVRLKTEMSRIFGDSLCRALAILKNCRLLASGELFDLLSPLRLAAREKMIEGISLAEIEALMNEQDLTNSEDSLPQDERDRVDAERADRINKLFEEVMLDDVL